MLVFADMHRVLFTIVAISYTIRFGVRSNAQKTRAAAFSTNAEHARSGHQGHSFHSHGRLSVTNGSTALHAIKSCYAACSPTWFNENEFSDRFLPFVNATDSPQIDASKLCEKRKTPRHLLVVDRWGSSSLYHFLLDTAFPAWTTRSQLALEQECRAIAIDVAILRENVSPKEQFE